MCRNRELCTSLYPRISHVWYRGANQSRSITPSITSKKNVCTNSNGDKSVRLVSTQWARQETRDDPGRKGGGRVCAHVRWSCDMVLFDVIWLKEKLSPLIVICCYMRYHDALCQMFVYKSSDIHMKPWKCANNAMRWVGAPFALQMKRGHETYHTTQKSFDVTFQSKVKLSMCLRIVG